MIILPFIWFGYETWSLKLGGEPEAGACRDQGLRKIFGPKRDEVTGECRRFHSEELYDLYPSPNIIRMQNKEE
jgi:hypothetical protein